MSASTVVVALTAQLLRRVGMSEPTPLLAALGLVAVPDKPAAGRELSVTRSAFFSFDISRDTDRASLVDSMDLFDSPPLSEHQKWAPRWDQGDREAHDWIDAQISDKDVVIVLVGSDTASQARVRYEIETAWTMAKPLLGVRIHTLRDGSGNQDTPGTNPFAEIDAGWEMMLDGFVTLHEPESFAPESSRAEIQENLTQWAEEAIMQRQ